MYVFNVAIKGMDNVPLRTTKKGVTVLIDSYKETKELTTEIIEKINAGNSFERGRIKITTAKRVKKEVANG